MLEHITVLYLVCEIETFAQQRTGLGSQGSRGFLRALCLIFQFVEMLLI